MTLRLNCVCVNWNNWTHFRFHYYSKITFIKQFHFKYSSCYFTLSFSFSTLLVLLSIHFNWKCYLSKLESKFLQFNWYERAFNIQIQREKRASFHEIWQNKYLLITQINNRLYFICKHSCCKMSVFISLKVSNWNIAHATNQSVHSTI